MATHDHAIVDAMRRRVVQLDAGRVIRDQRSGAYEIRVQSNVKAAEAKTPPPSTEPVDEDAAELDEFTPTPNELSEPVDDLEPTLDEVDSNVTEPAEPEPDADSETPTVEVNKGEG